MHNNLHVQMGLNLNGDLAVGSYMYRRVGPSITAYKSYGDNDKRKEGSFVTEITFSDGNTIKFALEDNGNEAGSQGWKTAFPGNVKYYDRSNESFQFQLPRANIYVLRYAEVLLNYAEAENELNGPADAFEAINKVRERAGLSALSGLNKQQMADLIYRERGWEFIGEAQLYFDELRTNRIGANIKKHWEDSKDIYLYKGWKLEFVPDKNFLWKIPQGDLDSNPALTQNPDNVSAG
jgi:hypothetical protein